MTGVKLTIFLLALVPFILSVVRLCRCIPKPPAGEERPAWKPAAWCLGFSAVIILVFVAFVPSPTGFWAFLAITGTFVLALVATVVLAVPIPENNFGEWLDRRLYGAQADTDPKPVYRNRYMWPAFGVVAFAFLIPVLWGLITGLMVVGNAPEAPGSSSPSSSATSPASPSSSAAPSSSSPAPVDLNCGVDETKFVAGTWEIPFYANGVEFCKDGRWEKWTERADITVTRWQEDPNTGYGYGRFDWKGTNYLYRTKDFK